MFDYTYLEIIIHIIFYITTRVGKHNLLNIKCLNIKHIVKTEQNRLASLSKRLCIYLVKTN